MKRRFNLVIVAFYAGLFFTVGMLVLGEQVKPREAQAQTQSADAKLEDRIKRLERELDLQQQKIDALAQRQDISEKFFERLLTQTELMQKSFKQLLDAFKTMHVLKDLEKASKDMEKTQQEWKRLLPKQQSAREILKGYLGEPKPAEKPPAPKK